ncbi:unknown protein [Seminavis robusta]|uniref:Uncharacterized protein n=1 Tax=Seminavis robusta TaxID=568900 RepID=A0A9N8EWN7_9STRA|nr:unknown protein [Seminavis robusta]|eukprot:Sro2275_g321610.1 n/a (102) ;mRNA; r:1148-1453
MTRNQRAEEILNRINDLAEELSRIQVGGSRPRRRDPHRHLFVGRKVLITRGDKYHGRIGHLHRRHEDSDYWDIELDLLDGQKWKQIIYKTPTGFRAYPRDA